MTRTLLSATILSLCVAAQAAEGLTSEPEVVDNRPVPVSLKKELVISVTPDPDVATRELWYAQNDGKGGWGAWQKHGISFSKDASIVWAPAEGHWKIYVRKILTSGLANPVPTEATKPLSEFITDRTAPAVSIGFPANKAKLRGGDKYTVKWDAQDLHLRTNPITILFSLDGKAAPEVVAAGLPNSGSYEWTVPKDMTTSGVMRIEAADKATNVGSAESTSLLIDSIKPRGKVTGPVISNKLDTVLELDIRDENSPAGLASAQLWVSQDDGTSWTPGPFVQDPRTVTWKAPTDGKFRLAIVASDTAGNTSPIPKGKADDQSTLIVDTTAPLVQLASAIGIIPSTSAAPTTQRAFKPGDSVQVQFSIKDANPLANTVVISFQADPTKPWQELAKGQPADTAFRFSLPAVGTKTAKIKVAATDAAGNTGDVVSVETFEIQTVVVEEKVDINL